MAKKVQPFDILPPPSSSDDEQPLKTQESDDETEDDHQPQSAVNQLSLRKPQETEDSDADSDETHDSLLPSAFTVKPVAPKHVLKSPQTKTPSSRPPRFKTRAKRSADTQQTETEKIDKVSKKSKKVVSGDEVEVEEKKSIIKWNEEDEIALLDGIVEYKALTRDEWSSKMDAFYEFVKDLIAVDLKKNQLSEKIKRLKKKFQTNVRKWQNGEEPVLRPHENKLFELSQKIWGSEGTVFEGNDSKVKSRKKKDNKNGIVLGDANTSTPLNSVANRELSVQEEIIMEEKKEKIQDFWSLYPRLCASLQSEASNNLTFMVKDVKEEVNEIVRGMGKEKARELEDEWKAFNVMEYQLHARRTYLINKQAEVLLDLHEDFLSFVDEM